MGENDTTKPPAPVAAPSRAARNADIRNIVGRLLKYLYLLTIVAAMSVVAYNSFSYYIARRDIDSEIRSKKGASLEYLLQQGRRRRELALTSISGRCTERMELALFRILDAEKYGVDAAYRDMAAAKARMVNLADKEGRKLIEASAIDKMNFQTFTLADYEKYMQPLNEALRGGEDYVAFRKKMDALRDTYIDTAKKYAGLKETFDRQATGKPGLDANLWSMSAIGQLAKLNEQTRAELKDQKDKIGDFDDVLSRYSVWTDALAGALSASQVLDDTAYRAESSNDASLGELKCAEFKHYYEEVHGENLQIDRDKDKRFSELDMMGKFVRLRDSYNHALLIFFKQPPSAQTLFVTILLGAIGAATLNLLRMSKVGWWSNQDDPLWGEIVVAPFLGALSAFAIFLVGSSGLLLTTDTAGNQPLSGYFIGLLGFLSGLVYDEAFGRVRRVGSQIFSANVDPAVASARTEDRTLAELLRANGADLFASLVLLHGYGTSLGASANFTLLVPSDEAMAKMPLGDWRRLNDLADNFKQGFLERHCADALAVSANPPQALTTRSGTTFAVVVKDGDFRIGGAQVIHRDLLWNKAVVHVLAAEPKAEE